MGVRRDATPICSESSQSVDASWQMRKIMDTLFAILVEDFPHPRATGASPGQVLRGQGYEASPAPAG